jgi:threonine dehydrogenase-like Zn-dependent dehydrogenase
LKAIVFDGQLRVANDYAEPQPPAGEVTIRTTLAGICNTDLEIVAGYAGFLGVLGHEFVGIVESAADTDLVGQRVVGEINVGCGLCATCHAGWPTHCPTRTALGIRGRDGALAERFCLPASNLHIVPENVPDEAAIFTEPLAAACQVVEQVHIQPTTRVVLLGDGKLGQLIAQVLALTGCNLTVVGRHEAKLSILSDLGIPVQIGPQDLEGSIDLVVECTGRAEGFYTARQLVRPRGTLVLKSTYHGTVDTDLSSLVVDEIQVVGSRCGPFEAALRLLDRNLVKVQPLIEAEYPLKEGLAAFEHAQRRGARKILVRP